MSSITRKNKRRAAFKCAKQGIAPAQAIAVSAAREIKATKEATAETMEVLLQAIALVAAHDYGKLNAKDTRLNVLAKQLYQRSARRFLEMPLESSDGGQLQVWVSKVNFPVHKDCGEGRQIIVQLSGFTNCTQALQVVTHKFYRRAAEYIDLPTGDKIPCQELLPDEIKTMKELQKEAFAYAYHYKREQPTVEEAQNAYESGAYPDEIWRDKA